MLFETSQELHQEEYARDGVTVFRGILPMSLVADLRRVAETARALARSIHGPQAQRLQPLTHADLDQAVLRDYVELPALVTAVQALLGEQAASSAGVAVAGMLFEPADRPWCTDWHRDWGHHGIARELWTEHFDDRAYFNQVNCALYRDDCLWVVPGSHRYADDLPEELAAKARMPALGDLSPEEAASRIRGYCKGMPLAVQLRLEPGDYALYRNTLWHIGAYAPEQRRATIHDAVETTVFRRWRDARDQERRSAEQARTLAAASAAG